MSDLNNSHRHTYGLLANVSVKELESIRVGIKRRNFTTTAHLHGPLERSLGDPKSIIPLVHSRKDNKPRPRSIFDREGILVNREDRLVTVGASVYDAPRSRSYSRSNSGSPAATYSRKRSKSSSRSRSLRRSLNRRKSTDRNVDRRESSDKDERSIDRLSHRRRSRDRSSDREYERRRSADKGRSVDREYDRRSTERDRYKDRRRSKERETTPKQSYEKSSYSRRSYSRGKDSYHERKRSITPLRPGEYRPNHPDLQKRSKSRDRYERNKSTLRRSKSLSEDRQLPSTSRKRSQSPWRKSSTSPQRSPKRRRTSKYSDRYERKKSRSTSPRSSSQYERYSRQKSRSPRPIGVSSSPRGSRDRKRYSRSPEYERYRRFRRRRSRSKSPKHKDMVQFRDPSMQFGYYEGIPGPEFWMHPGLIRPGYPMPRFYPPTFYPRGIGGAPVIFHPRHPMGPPIIRAKLPVYNTRPEPKIAQVSEDDRSTTVCSSTVQTSSEGGCTIEEMKSDETGEDGKDKPVETNSQDSSLVKNG